MKIEVQRLKGHLSFGTMGALYIDGKFYCFTLEDPWHMVKIDKDTRIPHGTYKVGFNMNETPLTKTYRAKYPFFDYHLMIKDIPNYSNVYIHIGNDKEDTEGCILVGDSLMNPRKTNIPLQQSYNAFKDFYKKVSEHLKAGGEVTITIE